MLDVAADLKKKRILVVEDDYLTASDLAADLRAMGIDVAGPAPSIEAALEVLGSNKDIDGAILDINLAGMMVFPLADELDRLSVPFIFATGYDVHFAPRRHAAKPFVQKPYDVDTIALAIKSLFENGPSRNLETTKNSFLALLPPDELAELLPSLSALTLRQGSVIQRQYHDVERVYFPTTCVASVLAVSPKGQRIEAGLVGREGMTGYGLVADDNKSPFETVAQVEGDALTMSASAFVKSLDELPTLRRLTVCFQRAMNIQVSYTALANGRFDVVQRLARWLLMLHDRTDNDRIPITHDYLALMLGVRRPGVTNALHVLEGDGFIRSLRREIIIKSRPGLVQFADDAYGVPEKEYGRLMGHLSGQRDASSAEPTWRSLVR